MPPAYLRGPDVAAVVLPYLIGCSSKIALTRREAGGVVRRRTGRGLRQDAYRCSFCGWWHTSHSDGAAPRRERGVSVGLVR